MKESKDVKVEIVGAITYTKAIFDKIIMRAKKEFCKENGWGLRETSVDAFTEIKVTFSRDHREKYVEKELF